MRLRRVLALALGLAAASALPARAQEDGEEREEEEAQEPEGGTLRVHIIGLRNDDGHIGCMLYGSAEGFPGEAEHALQKVVGRIGRGNRRTATCVFRDVPAGRYAVVVGHDENGNRRMDRNLVGLPSEGWGTSRDAPARMGPPQFRDAVFRFNGRRKLILVTMRYGF